MGTESSYLKRLQIVLVEPQEPANIGAVCRAMKTMGISRLAITGGRQYDSERIKTLALHAFDVYERHKAFPSLEEALADSAFSAGATRRRGKFRKYSSFLPLQLAELTDTIAEGTISLVFGREAGGLTKEELQCCDVATHIPSSDDFPSLNLAQAVQIYTYTFYQHAHMPTGHRPINRIQLDRLSSVLAESLEKIHFYKQNEREEVRLFLRDMFGRAALSETEAGRVEKMFTKIANLKVHRPHE
ncbi:MAG: RNA methyltransferase [Spirochaetota bacterium]